MRQALLLAEEANVPRGALRACMNLSYLLSLAGKTAEAETVIERGHRPRPPPWRPRLGALPDDEPDQLLLHVGSLGRGRAGRGGDAGGRDGSRPTRCRRPRCSTSRRWPSIAGSSSGSRSLQPSTRPGVRRASTQAAGVRIWARVLIAQAEGRHDDALSECLERFGTRPTASIPWPSRSSSSSAASPAFGTGDAEALAQLLAAAAAAPIDRSPSLEAHTTAAAGPSRRPPRRRRAEVRGRRWRTASRRGAVLGRNRAARAGGVACRERPQRGDRAAGRRGARGVRAAACAAAARAGRRASRRRARPIRRRARR